MSKKNIFILILSALFFVCTFFIINSTINKSKFNNLKSLISGEQRQVIKRYIFPYKYISQLIDQKNTIISKQLTRDQIIAELELNFKELNKDIQIKKSITELSNKMILEKYQIIDGFYAGINRLFPGSGYIDLHEDNLLVLSSRGIMAYSKNLSNLSDLKQIQNNIDEYINLNQFKKNRWFSLKDLFIFKNKVFISFTEEIKEDCWNTSVLYGDMNYEIIEVKKLFSPKECVHSINNIDKEFNAHQSGGRIVSFDDDHILLSTGDYRSRFLAQDEKSVNGKIIKININNSKYEVISMGHRNPQGLYFDKENNFILETEHGPDGGDEINLIEIDNINKDKIQNYGWAIASYGEHYEKRTKDNKLKFKKYPTYKSHSEYDFIEPLKSFVSSIGISEIVKIGKNKYLTSSLQNLAIYFFELNEKKQIFNLEDIRVGERVRDLKFSNNKLFLFLENTASIGVIDFK